MAFALGVGVAIFSGPSVASADAGDTEAAAPQSGRSGATASASESRAASATRTGGEAAVMGPQIFLNQPQIGVACEG